VCGTLLGRTGAVDTASPIGSDLTPNRRTMSANALGDRGVGLAELDADPDLFAFDSRQGNVSSFSFSWHNATFAAEGPR
jgi:hypothetical protein